MLFNSLEFVFFFPIVVGLYFALPHRFRWILLLAASYYFYMCWKAEYVVLIMLSTVVDYFASLRMSKFQEKEKRKPYLYLSLLANLGVLFGFKYFNFFNDSTRAVFEHFNLFYDVPAFDVLLPVGISFYTFQTLSYTIDVYNGRIKPESNLGIFALYVSFWPQLVAGPIERPQNLLHQFYEKHSFNYENVTNGLKLMTWGFFKKLVIADRLAVFVNEVYNSPQHFEGLTVILATISFAFQIFCDFSGYSDIAIGAALVMGYRLMKNFDGPYLSQSISEFWRRWHISLSTWFRDYVYIPLGGNRTVKWRWYYNLFITFTVSGLWHGANWTFVVWGALHGALLVVENMTKFQKERFEASISKSRMWIPYQVFQTIKIFALACLGWVFFRANTISDAWHIIISTFSWTSGIDIPFLLSRIPKFVVVAIGIMMIVQLIRRLSKKNMRDLVSSIPLIPRWTLYIGILLIIAFYGSFHSNSEFIYFQF